MGLAVYDATLDATRLTVEGTTSAARADDGFGVEAAYAEVTLRDSILRGNRVIQALVYGTGVLTLDGGSIEDGVAGDDGFASAVWVERGGTATLRGTTITGALGQGLLVSGSTSSLIAEELTLADVDGEDGSAAGIVAADGATLNLADSTIDGVAGAGLLLSEGATATVERSTFADPTDPNSAGIAVFTEATLTCLDCTVLHQIAAGVTVQSGGTAHLEGGAVVGPDDDHETTGLYAGDGGSMEAMAVAVSGGTGPGGWVETGASMVVADCTFEGTRGAGLAVFDGSTLTVIGGSIVGTTPDPEADLGFGIVALGSTVVVDGTLIDDPHGAGIAVSSSVLTANGVEVRGTDTDPDGDGGYGIEAVDASEATVEDSLLTTLTGVGLLASDGARVSVTGSRVERVYGNPEMRSGPGVAAQLSGRIDLADTTIRGCAPGLAALEGGVIEGSGVTLAENGFAGAVVAGGMITLQDSVIVDGVVDPATGGGVGVFVTDQPSPGQLGLARVTIGAHPIAAVWISGASPVTIVDSDLTGGPGIERHGVLLQGDALFATGAGAGVVTVIGTRLGGSAVAVLLHDATATLSGNRWEGNVLDLAVQGCGDAPPPDTDDAVTTSICAGPDRLWVPLDWSFTLPETDVGRL